MDIKLEKLNTIKEAMYNASDEELFSCIDRIEDILSFVHKCYYPECDCKDIVKDKLIELKNKEDFIYFKCVDLVFNKNTTKQVLIEILTNLLVSSLHSCQSVIINYITVLAFGTFSDNLRGEGYTVDLQDYLLSNFRLDFLIENWDKIDEKLKRKEEVQ